MIHVLQSQSGGYRDITEYLRERGARVTVIGPQAQGMRGKLAILLAMLSPSLLRCFGLWRRQDRLLVVGWQALPLLALVKARILPRPERLLVMGCFVHGQRARRMADRLLRALRVPGLGFIAFSPGEARNLVERVGMAPQDVYCHLWRQELDGRAAPQDADGSIFAGGFSNRDYDLLLDAAEALAAPLVIVASRNNRIRPPASGSTRILRDLPEAEFEGLLARSSVVAMPLRGLGEACGQSVLLRVLRHGKPLVATRHEAIEAYLGEDYPGFVPHDDVQAMRQALACALEQPARRAELAQRVRTAAGRLEGHGEPGVEIERFLLG
ncbi:glycosyltransferase [Pseudoduganella violaceinigra]|uniref:glycosyltransferase n=1 Tax=Pseudoduganella violaceinigra TaxID=246602 RepID=UPI00040D66E8|nr:glycosyltransferase [Pseudoduganella violaceinigra]